jgi:hypothetical protein
MEVSVRTAYKAVDFWTGHVPNTSLDHYHYTNCSLYGTVDLSSVHQPCMGYFTIVCIYMCVCVCCYQELLRRNKFVYLEYIRLNFLPCSNFMILLVELNLNPPETSRSKSLNKLLLTLLYTLACSVSFPRQPSLSTPNCRQLPKHKD